MSNLYSPIHPALHIIWYYPAQSHAVLGTLLAVSKVFFRDRAKRNNSLGSETVQLFTSLYYIGEAINLPEYTHMARRSS